MRDAMARRGWRLALRQVHFNSLGQWIRMIRIRV
jgi:hypothetical protein